MARYTHGRRYPSTAFAQDGIALPIADPLVFISLLQPLVNGTFVQYLAPAGGFGTRFVYAFSGDSQERTEMIGSLWITPYPAIDHPAAYRHSLHCRRSVVGLYGLW